MTVTITKKHIAGISFSTRFGGAISRAIAEQCPDIKVKEEFDGFIKTTDKKHFDFNNNDTGFSQASFNKLKNGELKEIRLQLEENKIY